MEVLNSFLPGGGEFAYQKIAWGFCLEGGGRGGGMVRLGID